MSNEFDWLNDTTGTTGTSSSGSYSGDDIFGGQQQQQYHTGTQGGAGKGGWHALLTIASLLLTAVASFGMAWTTRYIPQRSAILLGCTFAVPALVIMCVALLSECLTDAMTPSYSRKAQLGVALVAVLCCFIVGCFGEVVSGFSVPQVVVATPTPTPAPTPTPVVVTPTYNYVILLDKSSSMTGDWDKQSQEAVKEFLAETADGTYVGAITFSDVVMSVSDMSPLTDASRQSLEYIISEEPFGLTDFSKPIRSALSMVQNTSLPQQSETRILLVTDGQFDLQYSETSTFIRDFKSCNASLSCLLIGSSIEDYVQSVVTATDGMVLSMDDASKLHENLMIASQVAVTPSPTPTLAPTPTPEPIVVTDVIREAAQNGEQWRSSGWTSTIMMIAEGLIIGIILSLMLSRQGQRRFQTVLSVIMGIVAALILNLTYIPQPWVKEAIAFSCFGLVVMKKNR